MRDRRVYLMATALAARISRRRAIQLAAISAIFPFGLACGGAIDSVPVTEPTAEDASSADVSPVASSDDSASGKLTARPEISIRSGDVRPGLQSLGIERDEDALLYLPKTYAHDEAAPLAVIFHGAGGDARGAINLFQREADTRGLLLLATRSRQRSWDVTAAGRFGPDITFLDRALRMIFARYAIDPGQIAVAGFSDGASYALSVGLTNGGLFSAIMAFSPGFVAPGETAGKPRI